MIRLAGAILIVTATAAASSSPSTAEPRTITLDRATMDGLIDWIAANTGYDLSATRGAPPRIVVCEPGDTLDYEGRSIIVDRDLRGAFDVNTRTILLVDCGDLSRVDQLATILHELIHDVQTLNRDWSCWGDAEREAYQLQERWLAERGVDAGFDWFAIWLRTKCRDDIHP